VPDPASTLVPDSYPNGSTVTWVTKPDTTKPGAQNVSVIVTYPDGNKSHVIPSVITVIGDNIQKHQQIGTITVIRHVHFVEQGKENVDLATPVDQTVSFKVFADLKNGQPIDGTITLEPASGRFPAVAPASIAGYTVVAAEADGIAAENATPRVHANNLTETVDLDEYIHYTKDTTPGPQPNPQPNPEPEPNPEPQPEPKPNPQPNPEPKPNPQPTPTKPKKHVTHNKSNNGNGGNVAVNKKANARALKKANKLVKKTLPQTGAKSNGVLAMISGAVAAVAGLFGLAAGRKRKF
jgi:LPXTG-motif cell wall-anchored protein